MLIDNLKFTKMTGSGNDFIIIDNRDNKIRDYNTEFIKKVCTRSLSVGADGIIFIENSKQADFKWSFFNSDGSVAEMCGNGSRCVAKYAYLNGIAGKKMRFETLAGIISAEIKDDEYVKVQLTDPFDEKFNITVDNFELSYVNTGVPHAVIKTNKLEDADLQIVGSTIRFHSFFAPAGTNVDLYEIIGDNTVKMRTYERGVEGETFACGTGAAAVAMVAARNDKVKSPVSVVTKSSEILKIYLEESHIFLEGKARFVYNGELHTEAIKY